ncbi:flagellar FlbD family protein [Demequina sp.]|uniref:flagellar FlbD family protein n=1 Tax=Demequina sp. TaxID=2050685 RepID=UPI003A89ADFF
MIFLTRFHGDRFAVNPDLIQRIEATPDTVVTLIDGSKLLIAESLDDVSEIVLNHRASIASRAIAMSDAPVLQRSASVTDLPKRKHLHLTGEGD